MQIEVLGERYQLQEAIGRGGMATIYRGHDMRMDRVVAIKVLREVYSTDPKFVTRFQREAKAASSLQHPNIVQVYDYGQSEGNYFIVMELVEGMDLRRYLRSRGVLAVDRAVIITHDVALGLGAAHRRQIVHRDVKPQNILVGHDGSIKLTDFGIASVYKDINAERLTTTGMTLGTVQYYAPEQAQGEIVNPAADVYALGIVMYEMLTGRTPFEGDTPVAVAMQHIQDAPLAPSQLNPNIPPALEEIILRCLEKVPEMRYRNGTLLARALELLGEQEGVVALPATPTGASSPPTNGHGPKIHPTAVPNHGVPPAFNSPVASENAVGAERHSNAVPDQALGPLSSDPAAMTTQMEPRQVFQGAPASVDAPSTTRPIPKGALSAHSEGTYGDRESHIANIITIFILIATLLLLGFSIYLAGELNFVSLPGLKTQVPSSTVSGSVQVPDLINLDYTQAKAVARQRGFLLVVENNLTSGKVIHQSIKAGDLAKPGDTIQVELASSSVGQTVPAGLVGKSLNDVKQLLDKEGIRYTVISDPNDPRDPNKGPDTVTHVDPNEGQPLQPNQQVTLYVTNVPGSGSPSMSSPPPVVATTAVVVQPTPTPTPMTTPAPTPTPTPTQTPEPTLVPTPNSTPIRIGTPRSS